MVIRKIKRTLVCFLLMAFLFGALVSGLSSKKSVNSVEENCLSQILSKRYSGYLYDASKKVSQDQLLAILEAGRLSPSSYNEQPWNFIICDKNTDKEAYEKALSSLVEFNRNWAKNAPVLIVSVAASKSSRTHELNGSSQYDTGAATFGMMLEATSLGLMAHQMGGFDSVKIRQLFSIPEDYVPMAVMAIGYASSDEIQSERKRKALSENFFMGDWGNGLK